MWVRSYLKDILLDCHHFEIVSHEDFGDIPKKKFAIVGYTEVCRNNLGIYSDKQKAMKVMNMLEDHINKGNCACEHHSGGYNQGSIITQEVKVFQFPTDAEVQV